MYVIYRIVILLNRSSNLLFNLISGYYLNWVSVEERAGMLCCRTVELAPDEYRPTI